MRSEMRAFGVSVVMVSLLTAGHALSQPPGNEATSARTAWGHPDLQGVWDFATMTPLQRPKDQASEFLSEEEAAAAEKAIKDRIASELEVGSVIPADGRQVVVKGLHITCVTPNRINLTSLFSLADTCD